jgi:hypothetical protein
MVYFFLFENVLLTSMAERPAPTPIRMQTINRKVCAPEAIGELNISNSVIGKAVNEYNLWSKIT